MSTVFFTRLLLEQGDARVDCRDQTGGRTPLLLAARARQEAAVRVLVENGADPDLACGKVTPREVLRQELPRLNIEKITVRERPVENTVEMLAQLVERKGRGEEEEKRSLAIFKGVLAFLGVEEVRISDQTLNIKQLQSQDDDTISILITMPGEFPQRGRNDNPPTSRDGRQGGTCWPAP